MFKFKNISSNDMNVIIEEEESFLAKASQRAETIEIDGRDGAIYNALGYSNIERPIKVQILDISKLDEILAWLNGEGIFEYKDRITTVYFYSEIDPIRSTSIKIAEFNFIRSPFWQKKEDNYVVVTTNVINEGNIQSRPIIRIEKGTSNSIDVTVAGIRFTYDFNNENYVEIDCEEMNAKCDNLLRNRQLVIDYEFPILQPGTNVITINSGDPIIKIKRKDRWL